MTLIKSQNKCQTQVNIKPISQSIWHPFTQEKTAPVPILITKAKGSYLFDDKKQSYLDLISSWWVNLHGHGHKDIARAIYKQAKNLEHVIFARFTHSPALHLTNELKNLLPKVLSKFFFSDNGSTSVEIALKMSYQFHKNQGVIKRKFFCFEGGYHGDTFGAMSLGKSSGFFNPFSELLFEVIPLPYPFTFENDLNIEEKEERAFRSVQKIVEEHHALVASFIFEPLIQGASGMRIIRSCFLNKVLKLMRSYGILLICDEVMTGFGRTGTMFAIEQLDQAIAPDFLCLSKGLTGGFMPMGLTVTTRQIFNAFLDDKIDKAFLHGHSYSGNPIGCRAALASLQLFKKEMTFKKIENIEQMHRHFINQIEELQVIKAKRVIGSIMAFNFNALNQNYHFEVAKKIAESLLKKGIFIRPLGNTLYILPPYCIKQEELVKSYKLILDAVQSLKN